MMEVTVFLDNPGKEPESTVFMSRGDANLQEYGSALLYDGVHVVRLVFGSPEKLLSAVYRLAALAEEAIDNLDKEETA